MEKASKQNIGGMPYICGYCIVTALYYFVETKTLGIFYGNQSFYSVLVFLSLMLIPFWLILYYGNEELGKYRKRWFRYELPISFQFHHTQMDGAHAGRFLENLQHAINGLK